MPAPRLSRLCFSLKSLLLFNVVVAVLLVVAYPAWKEQAIKSVFIQGRPKPLWWPQSWRDYHDLLAHKRFEVVYTIDESLTERRLIEGLKFALESFVEGRTPLSDLVYSELAKAFHRETGIRPTVPPKVRWSADGNKCTVEATGDDHKHIHALVARWRARPFYSPREFEIR